MVKVGTPKEKLLAPVAHWNDMAGLELVQDLLAPVIGHGLIAFQNVLHRCHTPTWRRGKQATAMQEPLERPACQLIKIES